MRVSKHAARSAAACALVSCPGRVQRARLRERNESRDPAQELRSATEFLIPIRRVALGPGSRCARPGHESGLRRSPRLPLTDLDNERINVLAQRVAQETVCGKRRIPGEDARRLAALSRDAQGRGQRRRRVRRRTDSAFRDKERASKREWERRKRYREVYRISVADYDAMLQRQNGVCAICKRSGQALCVDHCHACGKVRGLLCGKCNSVLGFCDDSPAHLLAAAAYLRASCDQAPASSMTSVASVETGQSRASADGHHCRCVGKAL